MRTLALALPFWFWLCCSCSFYAAGEYLSKLWANQPSSLLTIAVVAAYAVCGLLWLPLVLHKGSLAVAGAIFLLAGTVITTVIGVVIFDERLSSLQILGMCLAVAAFVLLSTKG